MAGIATPSSASSVDAAAHANEMQRRQSHAIEQLRSRARLHPDVLSTPAASEGVDATHELPVDDPCFTLHGVYWQGEPPQALKDLANTVVGECVGMQGLQSLQFRLVSHLVESGLITARVVMPDQSVAEGTLSLRYVSGRIAAVHSASSPGWWRMTMPTGVGGELNQRDLDQALENIRRLKGQSDAHIELVPGLETGSSDVLLHAGTGKRWHAYVGADNAGLQTMGRAQLNAGFTLDSPFSLYDQLSAAWNSNAGVRKHHNHTHATSFNYNIPFGYWSVFAGVAESHYQQTLSGFQEPIVYGGTTKQLEAGISVVPYRRGHYKGTAVFKVSRKRANSTLNDFAIDVQRRDVTGYDLSLQHRHCLSRAVLDIGGGLRGTLPQYSNQPGYVYGKPEWNGRSTIFMANAGLYLPFTVARQPVAYQFNWHIQHAKTPIVPSDYFTIGDRYSVRGFDGQMMLAAEDGWNVRNEWSWGFGATGQQLYAGVDVGHVSGTSSQYLSGRTLTGAVLGLRGRLSAPNVDVNYDLSLGRPLKKPDSFFVPNTVLTAALSVEF